MQGSLPIVELFDLLIAFIPALIVVVLLYRWSLGSGTALYALARMMVQLAAIGYLLTYIFLSDSPVIVLVVLMVMLVVGSWIAMRPLQNRNRRVYARALVAITIGGVSTLVLVAAGVLRLEPFYEPRFLVPLAGMIFANSMNTLSLAMERFESELGNGANYLEARQRAFHAALIPLINSLLAVGLVSFPGMMTGQILSGVSPVVAARYQIVVMCMLFGAAGISTGLYLAWARRDHVKQAA